MLKRYKRGLVILSGCQGSLLFCSAVGGKLIDKADASYQRARRVAKAFKREFGDDYYIEVQAFPELEETRRFNPLAERLSRELGIGLCGTMDCHYTIPDEAEIQKILHNVRGGGRQSLEEQVRSWGYSAALCPPPNDRSMYRKLVGSGLTTQAAIEAIVNTETINGRIDDFDLPKLETVRYPTPAGFESNHEVWRQWLRDGWRYRGINKMSSKVRQDYRERLEREMKVIEDKDFIDYFLINSDWIKWAKDADIPIGPARGSAAASLVCYLLRITEVNPMVYTNLVFERFIDESRLDLPDIDTDVDSDRRHEVREYMVAKYGEGRVNNIGTFAYYKSKNSLDDVARVFKIPRYKVDIVKGLMIERSSGDLRASATIEDTASQFDEAREVFEEYDDLTYAMDLEGNIRGIGVHAAGLVISNGPVSDVCAVYSRKVKGVETDVVSLDKKDAERQGLVKIDALGLKTMAMMAEGLRQIDMKVTELYALPLDDEEVIDGFRQNDIVGIFQFDGRSMRSVNGALKPDSFKEICDVNALSRPGPLHNGAATAYIDIKRGMARPELVHPALDLVTKDTNYQIVYQEQILRIVREVGGFSWTHSAEIRKIIALKKGDAQFNAYWDMYWEGAQRLWPDMDEATARKIWGMLITAGSYAFNAAHSYSYGMLAYWTMWLKVKHPEVFFAASLAKMPEDKQHDLLRDAARHGVGISPPDSVLSGLTWAPSPSTGRILAGFGQIPGVGDKTAQTILAYRDELPEGTAMTWPMLSNIKGIGPKTVEKLESFVTRKDPFGVNKLDRMIAAATTAAAEAELPEPTHRSLDVPYERGKDETVVWIGTVRDKNIRDIFEQNRAKGEVLDPEAVKDAHLNEFAILVGDDGDELLSLRIDRWKYPKLKSLIFAARPGVDIILARGTKPGWRSARVINVNAMWLIDPELEDE